MASRLEKRMQVLIDDERFQRLEAEARASGTSVGSVVQAAIDEYLATGEPTRARAGHRLMAHFHEGGEPEPHWAEPKQALDAVHAATAIEHGLASILSPDTDFDGITGLHRSAPRTCTDTDHCGHRSGGTCRKVIHRLPATPPQRR